MKPYGRFQSRENKQTFLTATNLGGPKGPPKFCKVSRKHNCAQYVDRIEQHIRRLQAQIKDIRMGASVHDEIKKLEEHLKEANDNVRSLQIM